MIPTDINELFKEALHDHVSGRIQEAFSKYTKILDLNLDHSETLHHLGLIYLHMGEITEAISLIKKSLKLCPDNSNALSNIGYLLSISGNLTEAIGYCGRATQINPYNDSAWNNLGNAQRGLMHLEAAQMSYQKALHLQPENSKYIYNLANTYYDQENYSEASNLFQQCLAIENTIPEAHNNLAACLIKLNYLASALSHANSSIELKPDYAEAWSNRGNALNDLRRHEEALASYERSIELKPDYAEAICNKSLLQLTQRDFLKGFEKYLWRWETKQFCKTNVRTSIPLCKSPSLNDHVIFWAEQGLGDEVFYAGLLAQAQRKFSSISLTADARLHSIFSRSFPEITLLDRELSIPESFDSGFDSQAPIGNLGHILKLSNEEIKASRKPYLNVDPNKESTIRLSAPFASEKIICGLAWSSVNKDWGPEKSIDLTELEPILKNPKLEFINLQYGQTQSDIQKVREYFGVNIHQIEGLDIFHDTDGLLALIQACDLVITTSNVTAHLAGSIGKRGCVLVPFSRGKIWYWHLNDLYSFWYPSLRVFYQECPGKWSNTIDQVMFWLNENYI